MTNSEIHADSLPADLDPNYGTGEYQIPNNDKRKLAGYLYLLSGIVFVSLFLICKKSPLVNEGFLIAGIGIWLFGVYNFLAAIKCEIDERQALQIAEEKLGFDIGPCSAQLMWRGLRSRPVWRILAYSSELIPKQRAVLLIDAHSKVIHEAVVEENPEDWDSSTKQTT
ncbi:MAG: hypothetical protein CL431_01575 [Acidimicrobiaceae bacterium]|jgi:hypothetical protein|nr:hypothetical protein [Acidimicrobiaceae bacterium]|tara:strand:+ start:90132 stop:90635 length:504 start_codon:yes stop_codon:yes gene_type:complete